MNQEPYVRFRNVRKTYDGRTLTIKGLDLDILKGEFLTLLGPSGSGKTTTLMMLAGFEQPNAGEIMLDERDLRNIPPHRRDFGMVFQDYALFPHMSVAENIAFPLQTRRMARDKIREETARALQLVRLDNLGERMPGQLSGGQQQRVALARALVFGPRVLLMDEPLGALDKQLRDQMQIEIKHIQNRLGITAVYVTHDQSEALTMSDRIAVFSDGEIRQIDTPHNVYEHPKDSFVARFVGENNELRGTIESIDGNAAQVRLPSGDLARVSAAAGLTTGESVSVWVRPENMIVEPELADDMNIMRAMIEEVIYQGDHYRISMRINDLTGPLIAKESNQRHSLHLARDQSVALGWKAEHGRVLRVN